MEYDELFTPKLRIKDSVDREFDPRKYALIIDSFHEGVPNNEPFEQAIKELEELMNDGFTLARTVYACLLDSGIYVDMDAERALRLYKQSAEEDCDLAQLALGCKYLTGKNVPQSYEEARMWLDKAYMNGNDDAARLLGRMYYEGSGVEKDLDKAMSYMRMAAENGNAVAQFHLAMMMVSEIPPRFPYEEYFSWMSKSAEQGYWPAFHGMWGAYHFGLGVEKSVEEERKWIIRYAEKGNAEAKCVGFLHIYRIHPEMAVGWIKSAAEEGYPKAQYLLGALHMEGKHVEFSAAEAERWLTLAAENGYEDAKKVLEECFPSYPENDFENYFDL